MNRDTAIFFLNKFVRIERKISDKSEFSKGLVVDVTDSDLVLKFNTMIQAYSLESILSIREINEER